MCLPAFIKAQVGLPYYSGFDNTAERAGWQIYRLGENALANWSLATVGGFSPTSNIGHDYAPSTGAVLADDWYVSPGFLIPAGGSLDSVRYFFSGFSVPADDDTIGIYLLTGSQNPANATSITLLADFRGDSYQADATYRLLSPRSLDPTQETAYIAVRYRNAQVSSRWLTVRFDNVAMSGTTTAVIPVEGRLNISVFPNPCLDIINILHSNEGGEIMLYDYSGKEIYRVRMINGHTITSLPVEKLEPGLYQISLRQNGHIDTEAFIKN